MSRYAGIRDWLRSPIGLTCAFICVVTGLILGLYAWSIFSQRLMKAYYVDFSGSQWIAAKGSQEVGYFRKDIRVTSDVSHAWLAFAATDYYQVTINGTPLIYPTVGQKFSPDVTDSFIGGDQETMFDITDFLLPGDNVIGVYVRRRMMDRDASLLVKGMIQAVDGSQLAIRSDNTWKAKPVPDDVVGITQWYLPTTPDDSWPKAVVLNRPVPGNFVQPVNVPPTAFQRSDDDASWITTETPTDRQCYFRRDFDAPLLGRDMWLELAASGPNFEVYLNDHLVTNQALLAPLEGNAGDTFLNSSSSNSPNASIFVCLNSFVHWGHNRLEVRMENSLGQNSLFSEIVSVRPGGAVSTIPSDSRWTAHTGTTANWAPARELASNGSPPFGQVMKLSFPGTLSSQGLGALEVRGIALCLFVLAAWCGLWMLFSRTLADHLGIALSRALVFDALAQLPTALVLVWMWLSTYDTRFHPDWIYQPMLFWLVLCWMVLIRMWLWTRPLSPAAIAPMRSRFAETRQFMHRYGFGIAVLIILVCAFTIRVSGLMTFSLDHDEIFIRNVDHGIVERGFPSISYNGLTYRLTTYELLPWAETVCGILTGWQDWSLRVPSLLFGTACAGMMAYFGSQWFGRRAGLTAGIVYAFLPWNVYWSRHCFHLQQAQFFALLTFYVYWLAIKDGGGMNRRYWSSACILFCCTYLTWEGSGFILAAFAVAVVALHPKDWSWLRQFHFWTGFCFVVSLVLVQLADRAMTLPPYLGLGSGLSDISSPTLMFLDPNSQLLFYISRLAESQSFFFFFAMSVLGLFLCWGNRQTRYVLVIYFSLLACYTCLLAIASIRYAYFYEPMLVLGGIGVAFQLYDRVVALARSVDYPWIGSWARWSTAIFMAAVFLVATGHFMKLDRLTTLTQNPEFFFRNHDGYVDYQRPSKYVTDHYRAGDAIIAISPHSIMHFSHLFCYGLNPLLVKRMYYIRSLNPPIFVDRYSGTLAIRNPTELADVFGSHKRVWIVAAPDLAMGELVYPQMENNLYGISRLVYEDTSNQIFLWDGESGINAPLPLPYSLPTAYGAIVLPMAGGTATGSNNAETATSTSSSSPTTGNVSAASSVSASGTVSLMSALPAGGFSSLMSTGHATTSSGSVITKPAAGGSPGFARAASSPGATLATSSSSMKLGSLSPLSANYSAALGAGLVLPGQGSSSSIKGSYNANPAASYSGEKTTGSPAFSGGGGASAAVPSGTLNPARSSSEGVNSNSYSVAPPSSGGTGPAPVLGPGETASPYRNVLPSIP